MTDRAYTYITTGLTIATIFAVMGIMNFQTSKVGMIAPRCADGKPTCWIASR